MAEHVGDVERAHLGRHPVVHGRAECEAEDIRIPRTDVVMGGIGRSSNDGYRRGRNGVRMDC